MNRFELSPAVRGVARGVLLFAVAFASTTFLAACGDDPSPSYTLVLRTDRSTLTSDGTDTATVTVSVLDQNFNPPAFGSTVTLVSSPGGNINDTGESFGQGQTDPLGFVSFQVRCTAEETMQIVASYEGSNGVLIPGIDCREAPDGNWQITVSAEPRRIQTNAASTVTIAATDENGDPVPSDTGIDLEITSGNMTFANGGQNLSRGTNDAGIVQTTVISGDVEDTSTVCASFNDTRYGTGAVCVAIIVSNEPVTEASCIATFSSATAPADGRTVTTVTFTIANDVGTPVEDATIDVAANAGTFLTAAAGDPLGAAVSLESDINGDAVTWIRSPSIAGAADLRATAIFSDDGDDRELTCEFSDALQFFGPPTCEFTGMDPELLGVRDSGLDESGVMEFCFTTSFGDPVDSGVRVDFELEQSVVGARLSASSALTDSTGCAKVALETGTQAGVVQVRASLPFGDNASTCPSAPLPIRGGRPTEQGWNLRCSQSRVASYISREGDEVFSECPVTCWTYLRDRWGNPVTGDDVEVFFAAETGTIVSPVTPDANGRVTTTWTPNGLPPVDVDPFADEPRLVHTVDGTTLNPRDSAVTIIAWTNGEEAFEDDNGDGFYQDGEVFTDLAEPWVDVNDNDEFEPNAPLFDHFIDIETADRRINDVWDDANGTWDGNTAIWARQTIFQAGRPVNAAALGYGADPSAPDMSPQATLFYEQDGAIRTGSFSSTSPVFIYMADQYLNPAPPTAMRVEHTAIGGGVGIIEIDTEDEVRTAEGGAMSIVRRIAYFDAGGSETTPDRAAYHRWQTVVVSPTPTASGQWRLGNVHTFGFANDTGGVARTSLQSAISMTESNECPDVELLLTAGFPNAVVN